MGNNLASDLPTVSASELQAHLDCPARVFHDRQRYQTGLVETDRLAAELSSAIHNALMALQQRLANFYLRGRIPRLEEVQQRLRCFLNSELLNRRLDVSDGPVAERLAWLSPGFDAVAELLLSEIDFWGLDESKPQRELLVWAEQKLDHGRDIPAVRLAPGYLVRTRPDLIGLQPRDGAVHRIVIRDFKAKREPVDPAFDIGILVRAIWALIEARAPRCSWFLAGRPIQVDTSVIDVEAVNLAFAGTDQFHLRRSLTAAQLEVHRQHLLDLVDAVAETLSAANADEVDAKPSGLCRSYCPFLGYCQPGQTHVLETYGPEVLEQRLASRERNGRRPAS